MRNTNSFSIDFILRRSVTHPVKALVYARITINGVRREISLKQEINFDDWSHEAEKVRGKSREYKGLNEYVEEIRHRARTKYRELEATGGPVTAEDVKQAVLGIQPKIKAQKGRKLLELLEYYEKIWRPKLRWGGFKNYLTTTDYLRRFVKFKCPEGDMLLKDFDMEAATEFEYFVRHNPNKNSDPCLGNGLSKHIQRVKRIFNWAVELQWLIASPIEKYSRPMVRPKRKKLTLEEIMLLEKKQFPEEKLAYVKELFLFSIYTGLAYADVMALKPDVFRFDPGGTARCNIYRVKSDGLCHIPILSHAMPILRKYLAISKLTGNERLFPQRTNQHINWYLGVIREACGIETPMTFHIARHTFAKTVALKNGMPLETVQKVMGHSKIATTQIYADVDEDKILTDMTTVEKTLLEKRKLSGRGRQ